MDQMDVEDRYPEWLLAALNEGWVGMEDIQALERRLGRDAFAGFASVVLNDLKKPVLLAAAGWNAVQGMTEEKVLRKDAIVLLPDAAQIWRRVSGYLGRLLDQFGQRFGPRNSDASIPMLDDAEHTVRWVIGEVTTATLVETLEEAASGNVRSMVKLLALYTKRNWKPWKFPAFPSFASPGPGRPSDSVIAQADAIFRCCRDRVVYAGPVTAALAPGLVGPNSIAPEVWELPGIAGLGNEHYLTSYTGYLRSLRDQKIKAPDGVLVDLAHLWALADLAQVVPTVVTGDWELLTALARWGNIDLSTRGNAPFGKFLTDIGHALPFSVALNGVRLNVMPIDGPANPQLSPTPMLQLMRNEDKRPVSYGTEVVLDGGTSRQRRGYVYGYDSLGNVRVLWEDGETLELLEPNTPIRVAVQQQQTLVLTDQPTATPVPMPAHGAIPAFPWKPVRYTIDKLVTTLPAFAQTAPKLRALIDRKVAEHPSLTIRNYVRLVTDAGFACYIVGGAVRDVLLGGDPNDIDLASAMPAPDMYQAIVTDPRHMGKKSGKGGELQVRKNFNFGTVQVEPTKVTGLDIISIHDTPHGNSLSVDLDAYARDFTVNAVYYDPITDTVIDPTGAGLADLTRRTLNFVLQPDKQLPDDLVLIGRWVKFVVKGFSYPKEHIGYLIAGLREHLRRGVDTPTRVRFVDRSGMTPGRLIKVATEINAELGGLVATVVFPNL